MHVHVPKPLHGWKALFNEIFVIVIGVLIALGFEQVVEDIHWRHKVEDGEERLKLEGQQLYIVAAEQIATGPCKIAQFDRLMQRVAASGARLAPAPRWPVQTLATERTRFAAPEGPLLVANNRIMSPSVWEALKQEGVVLRMPARRQRQLGIVYSRVAFYNEMFKAGLRPPDTLAMDIPLDAAGRILLLNELSRERENYRSMINYAILVASGIRDLGFAPPVAVVEADVANDYTQASDQCAAIGHPLADWKAIIARESTLAKRGY